MGNIANMAQQDMVVYMYYWEDADQYELGRAYLSPIPKHIRGADDTHPSFNLYEKDDRIYWKDYSAVSPITGGTPIDLVILMEGWVDENNSKAYHNAMTFIEEEILSGKKPITPPARMKKHVTEYPNLIWSSDMEDFELEWWDQYYQTKEDLEFNWVYSLRQARWENGTIWQSSPDNPSFLYVFEWGSDRKPYRYKIYRPYQDKGPKKFRMYRPGATLEGLAQLIQVFKVRGRFDYLFIVSSTKDRLAMNKAGFFAINPTGESHHEGLTTHMPLLKKMAKHLVWFQDTDAPGLTYSCTQRARFGGHVLNTGPVFGEQWDSTACTNVIIKDQSDYISKRTLAPNNQGLLLNTPTDLRNLTQDLLLKVI